MGSPSNTVVSMGLIVWLWMKIPSEMAPMEDRSTIQISSTAQEGATFDYKLRYSENLYDVMDVRSQRRVLSWRWWYGFAQQGESYHNSERYR